MLSARLFRGRLDGHNRDLTPPTKPPNFDRDNLTDSFGTQQTVQIVDSDDRFAAEFQQQIAVFEPSVRRRTALFGADDPNCGPLLNVCVASQSLRDTHGLRDDS